MNNSKKVVRQESKQRDFKSFVGEEDKSMQPRRYLETDEPLDFWNYDNPRSVINLVSNKVAEACRNISPRWLQLQDNELRKHANVQMTDDMIRQAFWAEYFDACDANRPMRMAAVYGQIVSKQTFYEIYVDNPAKLAWILRPPKNYTYRMTSLLELGLTRLEDILNMDITKKDTKLIAEIVKVVALLDNRVKGAVQQRVKIETENKHLHAHVKAAEIPKTYNEIEKELKDLDKEIKQLAASRKSAIDEVLFGSAGGDEEGRVVEASYVEAEATGVGEGEG
jgi:hypothetical protein